MENFSILSINDIKNLNQNDQNEFIEKILKGEGKVSLITGAPKSGKSTLALNFAKAIASGTPFLGYNAMKSSVLYISLDSEADTIAHKINAMGVQNNLNLYFVTDVYIQLGNDVELSTNDEIPTLLEVLQEAGNKINDLKVVI